MSQFNVILVYSFEAYLGIEALLLFRRLYLLYHRVEPIGSLPGSKVEQSL